MFLLIDITETNQLNVTDVARAVFYSSIGEIRWLFLTKAASEVTSKKNLAHHRKMNNDSWAVNDQMTTQMKRLLIKITLLFITMFLITSKVA